MGTETKIPRIKIDWTKAKNFASIFDENPVHLTGEANEVLPPFTVSGLYSALIILRQLFVLDPMVVCADKLNVQWVAPVLADDILSSEILWILDKPFKLDPTHLRVIERAIKVSNQHDAVVMLIYLRQIRKQNPSHETESNDAYTSATEPPMG